MSKENILLIEDDADIREKDNKTDSEKKLALKLDGKTETITVTDDVSIVREKEQKKDSTKTDTAKTDKTKK